jgi:hypothetical protein
MELLSIGSVYLCNGIQLAGVCEMAAAGYIQVPYPLD